ncbi:helix-turn-helix transcriptional regulator [Nocardioides sp.]|uniref:helix-turn-helix transcriptional regulator n=1 Tax=Nocardioides sp. TaxID=35761 RepID=UPI0039E6C38E
MRADRLLRLLALLQRHRRITAARLAAELEVSERTVLRDMEALSAAGVPVYTEQGRGGGCVLLEDFTTRAAARGGRCRGAGRGGPLRPASLALARRGRAVAAGAARGDHPAPAGAGDVHLCWLGRPDQPDAAPDRVGRPLRPDRPRRETTLAGVTPGTHYACLLIPMEVLSCVPFVWPSSAEVPPASTPLTS